ncbi:hypothetical protein EV188_10463 [Actinomycetospora succinea]|uniref:Uncharacterized protein n=1 Tax=Actinomycetospora succinea TaxID=663603 RepID=A0A4R6VCC3_9PSEU|nr:hypothetical protein [Actinomycetospora succinea]TDQ58324.1 hypothetical protein EV188_10463 [Actinomycetospora succinea]
MSAPAASVGAGRGPWIASAALGVAILVAAALAVLTLVTTPISPAGTTEAAPPAQPAPAPSAAAAPAPTPAPVPAGTPAVTDTAGRALPAAVATGVQGLYTAIGTGDLPAVQQRYQPSTAVNAAPWSQVAPLLSQPANRDALLAALREPPQRRAGLYRYTAAGGALVGVDAQGRMAFIRLP